MSTAKHTPGPWEVCADRAHSGQPFWKLVRQNPALKNTMFLGRETLLTPKGVNVRRFLDKARAEQHCNKLNGVAIWEAQPVLALTGDYYTVSRVVNRKRVHLECASDGRPMLYGPEQARAAIAKAQGVAA